MRNRSKLRKSYHKPGTSPGTLAKQEVQNEGQIFLIKYSQDHFSQEPIIDINNILSKIDSQSICWLNFSNFNNVENIQKIGEIFKIHQLALEDLTQHGQRPKFDTFDDYYYLNLSRINNLTELSFYDVNIFYTHNLVLSFIEDPKNPFDILIERIKFEKSRHRKFGADYLVYSMIDMIIDEFFPLMDNAGERIEQLEEELLAKPTKETYQKIYKLKRELFFLRRIVWAEREIINRLSIDIKAAINDNIKIYLKDCYDHAVQIMDIIEMFRESTTNMVDVYLSSTSNRLNEVMKVLTIIATIFMPLSFLASLYGMNFDTSASPFNMPELKWFLGYPFVLSLMFLTSLGMLYYFKKKGWFD